MTERVKAATAVYLILRKGRKVLIALRANTGYQDGNYQVPAGHIEPGELPKQAMIREAKEEIGIDIFPSDLELVHIGFRTKIDDSGDRVDLYFETGHWSGDVRNLEPLKCAELRWVEVHELPRNVTPHVRIALEYAEQDEVFSELNLEYMRQTGMYKM